MLKCKTVKANFPKLIVGALTFVLTGCSMEGVGGFEQRGPDLIVTAASIDDAYWGDDGTASFNVTIENIGLEAVSDPEIGLYLSFGRNFAEYGSLLKELYFDDVLKANSSASGSFSLDVADINAWLDDAEYSDGSSIPRQAYMLGFVVDPEDEILESNEDNNDDYSKRNPIDISNFVYQPDITIASVDASHVGWADGETVTASVGVKNIGGAVAAADTVKVYLSTDTTINNADVLVGEYSMTGPLGAGATELISISKTIDLAGDGWSEGAYYVGLILDEDENLVESNNLNNMLIMEPIMVSSAGSAVAELYPSSLNINNDSDWADGDSVVVNFEVFNLGGAAASASTTAIYLSTDDTITSADVLLGTVAQNSISAGQGETSALTTTLNSATLGLSPGVYHVGILADSGSAITELDEDNNSGYGYADHASLTRQVTIDGGDAPTGVDLVDATYDGKWGWRGNAGDTDVGVDGPRGTGVHAWGASRSVADFETDESYNMGRMYHDGAWGTTNNSGDVLGAIGARHAYAMGLTGAGVKVAVVDSTIQSDHEDLDDNFLKNYDISGGRGSTNPDNHGTHVAGIIAAEKGNGTGAHGVAYDAEIIGIGMGIGDEGGLTFTPGTIAAGINSAVADGARIFNNSWGSVYYGFNNNSNLDDQTYRDAVIDAIDAGAVFVWAAGNNYSAYTYLGDNNTSQEAKAALRYAELADGWVNVVNLDWDPVAERWVIANETGGGNDIGSQICGVTMDYCLGAPGTNIGSTVLDGTYDNYSGTSMAAPMVSGGIAILFQAFPYVETADILQLLFATADDLGEVGVDRIYGHGMMNLASALQPSGSMNIATTSSTNTNRGIAATTTSLKAEGSLLAAISSAASDLVVLDDFDRAFTVGATGISSIAGSSLDTASLSQSLKSDFDNLATFGAPMTEVAATSGALGMLSDQVDVGTGRFSYRAVTKETSASAEMQYLQLQSGEGWKVAHSASLIEEDGQLFGNVGTGAYALVDRATTVSVAANGSRQLGNDWTMFGGIGLSQTDVDSTPNSLIDVSDHITSASALVGVRRSGIGVHGTGEFALHLGQERMVFDGSASIRIPVGREDDGVILFEETQLSNADLSLLPKIEVVYTQPISNTASYAISAAATQEESLVSANLERAF